MTFRGPIFYDSADANFYADPASTSIFNNVRITTLGVGTPASGTTGEIRATNEVTAYYSDRRLKTDIEKIDNALEKITRLNGVTYRANEIAVNYGYDSTKKHTGLLADEVQEVLPEVIRAAPFDIDENGKSKSGENFLTVQYEKIIPLLIEGIKELSKEVEQLKLEITELQNHNS